MKCGCVGSLQTVLHAYLPEASMIMLPAVPFADTNAPSNSACTYAALVLLLLKSAVSSQLIVVFITIPSSISPCWIPLAILLLYSYSRNLRWSGMETTCALLHLLLLKIAVANGVAINPHSYIYQEIVKLPV